MGKKSKKIVTIPPMPTSIIALTRYTLDVWMESYPDSTKEEWAAITHPDSTLDYLLKQGGDISEQMNLKGSDKLPPIKLVVLDDEYLAWLKQNYLENTSPNRLKYASTVVDEENAIRLLRKNHWDVDYELYCIPVYVIDAEKRTERTNYKLTKELKDELHKYICAIYGEGDIFLSDYILKMDEYFNNSTKFLNMAKSYFEDNTIVRYDNWDTQTYRSKDINIYTLVIPFVKRRVYKSAVFDDNAMADAPKITLTDIAFTQECFEEFGICGLEDFEGSALEKAFFTHFGENFTVSPYAISIYDIPEEYDMFISMIKNATKKAKKHIKHS